MEGQTERWETQRAKEGKGRNSNPRASHLQPRTVPHTHLHNENRDSWKKISSAFKTSLPGWPRTFPSPFLCPSPEPHGMGSNQRLL